MNEEMSIDEAIEILKESKVFDVEMLPIYGLNDYTQAIKSILADRESLEKENANLEEKYRKVLSDLAEAIYIRIVEGGTKE